MRRFWRALATGYHKETGRELLFLLDESETFQDVVDATRAADMGIAVREMFDAANKAFGVVMGLTAPRGRGGNLTYHPLGRQDVLSRVQDCTLQWTRTLPRSAARDNFPACPSPPAR